MWALCLKKERNMDVLTTSSLRILSAIAVSVCFERCQTRFSTLQSAESIYRLVSNGAKVAGEQAGPFPPHCIKSVSCRCVRQFKHMSKRSSQSQRHRSQFSNFQL